MPLWALVIDQGLLRQSVVGDTVYTGTLIPYSVWLKDSETLVFGDDSDITVSWENAGGKLDFIGSGIVNFDSNEVYVGSLYADRLSFNDDEYIYFGDTDDASVYYDGTDLVLNPKAGGFGALNILGTARMTKLRIGGDLAGYETYPFTVNIGGGGIFFNRDSATAEAFIRLTNNTAMSGGQFRGLTSGGLAFSDNVNAPFGVEINTNGLDLNAAVNNNHLLLRGGDSGASTTGNQIRFTWNGGVLLAHGIRTRHNNAAGSGNALDFYLWLHGTDSTSVTMGTMLAFQIESDGIKLPLDNHKLLFGAGEDASIYYDATDLILNPKEAGAGKVDILGTLQTDGYNSSDGTAGATASVAVAKVGGGTRTLEFKNGLYTSFTDS